MNLGLYGSVLWRFRVLVLLGLLLATALAVLTTARPVIRDGRPTLVYRHAEVWQNEALLIVTQRGAPEFRSVFPAAPAPKPGETPKAYPYADPRRFADLTVVYSQLATSDDVKAIMREDGPVDGKITAEPVPSFPSAPLIAPSPLIALSGESSTPAKATALTVRASRALLSYLESRQKAAGIPPRQRVVVDVVRRIDKPQLVRPRSKALPIIVFLAGLSAIVGLAFVMENIRPRRLSVQPVSDTNAISSRRSA